MSKVFIGGSRRISRLDAEVRERLDRILAQEMPVLIGDANGADKAVQRYLDERGYRNVEVFCAGRICRNNVGQWRQRPVSATRHSKSSFRFYAAKDRAMTQEADYGFMVWDGSSGGTLLNVLRLVKQKKKVVVYDARDGSFWDIKHEDLWREFVARCDPEVRELLRRRANAESSEGADELQRSLLSSA